MKKYLLLLAAFGFFFFASCSDDDDNKEEMSIVATWTLESVNPPQAYDLSSCDDKPTITFKANNSADWVIYDSENGCQAINSSGDWTKNSNGTYTVEIPELGTFTGNVEFDGPDKFNFSTVFSGFTIVLTFQK